MGTAVRQLMRTSSGFTLVELIVSITVMGILMVGLGSVIFVASQALPDADRLTTRVNQASEVANRLVEELQEARHITERTATTIAFTVADRDDDGSPEHIRYAWSGTAGDPLTRQYNHGTDINLLADVNQFDLRYNLQTKVETYPGLPVEGAEVLLSSYTQGKELKNFEVNLNNWPGQYFEPSAFLPSGTVNWRVTRVKFEAKLDGTNYYDTNVQLRPADAENKPTTTVLEQQVMHEWNLTGSYVWQEFSFAEDHGLLPGAALCLVLQGTGNDSAGIQYENKMDYGATGRIKTSNSGDSWEYKTDMAMRHEIYGKATIPGPDQTVTRQHVTGIAITLQNGTEAALRLDTAMDLPAHPEELSAVWELDFNADPTALDWNGDNVDDWSDYSGTFNPADLSNGIWYAPNNYIEGICTGFTEHFTEVTTVDLTYRATSVGGYGAVFWIYADHHGGSYAPIHVDLYKPNASSQQLWIGYELNGYLKVYDVPDDFVDVRLIIDPVPRSCAVFINGVHRLTYPYIWGYSSTYAGIWLYTDNVTAEFDHASIRVGGNE